MPVPQGGSTTPPQREAFSWSICKACCWYIALYMLTSRQIHVREPQDWGKGIIDLDPAFFDKELTLFTSTNLLLSLYMMMTIDNLLGCLTSRQSEELQFNLFLHYTFKYVLMRLLLPSNIEGLYTWLAWFLLVGQLHIILGICRCRLDAQLVSPSTTIHSYTRSIMMLMGTAVYSMVTMSFISEAISGVGELKALARSSEGILGEGMSFTSGLALAAVKLRGVDTEPQWGSMTASLFMYDLVLAGIECVRLIMHNCIQILEMLVTKRAEIREARAAFLQQQQQQQQPHVASLGSDGIDASNSMASSESSAFSQFKGTFLFHLDLLAELACLSLSGMQHSLLWMIQMGIRNGRFHWSHGVLGFDYMRILLGVRKRVMGYWHYRAVTQRLKHAFQDVRPLHPEPCSICMDTMVVGKQLPCGHQFHLACLRAWMQQSGAQAQHLTCPNCRQPLMPKTNPEEEPVHTSDSAHVQAHAAATAHAAAPFRAASVLATLMLFVPRFVLRAATVEYIQLLQLGTGVLLWWVSQLAHFLRRYAPSLPARMMMALQTNWPTAEEMEGSGESSDPHEREALHIDLHPPQSRGPFAWLMRVLGVRSQARDEQRMEQQHEVAEVRRRRHRVSGGRGAAREAELRGGGGSGGDGVGNGGEAPSLRRRRRRSSGRQRSEGGHGTTDGWQQGGGGREMGSLMQQVRQARANLMRAVDLVVAMHLLIEYIFLQSAIAFLHNFTIGTSYRSPEGTAPPPAAPAAAAAPEPHMYEAEEANMDDDGGQDMPLGSRTAIPSCSSIAHHGHSFAIAAAGASVAEVESGPMDDGDISSRMWTMEASPVP